MKVTIWGAGYVGLVTGACMAAAGNEVLCIDVDQDKVESLNAGVISLYEPGLEAMVRENHANGRLHFTTDAKKAVGHGLFQFIAVGTPGTDNGSVDLQYVISVARTIGEYMDDFMVVVNKSTVPVGTADRVRMEISKALLARSVGCDFSVVSNPEFLKEGSAVDDFMKPDRIVIGADDPAASDLLRKLYNPFNRNHDRIIVMDVRSAEFTKYAANAMLATRISFMNELANLAEHLGVDIESVRHGIGSDRRIGYSFIYPGCGYGGSCFPKDVKALASTAGAVHCQVEMLHAVENINNRQKRRLFEKIDQHYGGRLAGKTFAVWGLAFKPNTDDMREAPSRVLIEALIGRGATVNAYDPEALTVAKRIYGDREGVRFCGSHEEALHNADALCVVTEWKKFWSPDFQKIKTQLRDQVIFDGRNIYDPEQLKKLGIKYYGIGRSN